MNSSSYRAALYGWPAVAVMLVLFAFYGIFILPHPGPDPSAGAIKPPRIKFLPNSGPAQNKSEHSSEIHAFLASDLFASSRSEPIAFTSNTDFEELKQHDVSLMEAPLFLSLSPATPQNAAYQPAFTHQSADHDAADLPSPPHIITKRPTRLNSIPVIKLHGDLRQRTINSEALQALALRQSNTAWHADAEVRFNDAGIIEYCLLESTDCDPPLRQEVIKAICQCRLVNSTVPCGGRLEIIFPAYHAKDIVSSASSAERITVSR